MAKKRRSLEDLIKESDPISEQDQFHIDKIDSEITDYFNVVNTDRLLKEPKRTNRWLVEGMFHAAGTSLFVGREKAGKTTIVSQLALAVAQGSDFLGRKCNEGLVFYLALEEDRDETKIRLAEMGSKGEENLQWHFGAIGAKIGRAHV